MPQMVSSETIARLLRAELNRNPGIGTGRGNLGGGITAIAARCNAAGYGPQSGWETWIQRVLWSRPEVGQQPAEARLQVDETKVDKLFQAMDWTHLWYELEDELAPVPRRGGNQKKSLAA
jgi:hypothetical protein